MQPRAHVIAHIVALTPPCISAYGTPPPSSLGGSPPPPPDRQPRRVAPFRWNVPFLEEGCVNFTGFRPSQEEVRFLEVARNLKKPAALLASPRAPKTPTAAHFWVDELPRAFDVVGGDLSSFLRHSVRKIFCRWRSDACDRSDHLDRSVSVWNKSLGNSNHRRFLRKGGIYPSWESVSLRRRPPPPSRVSPRVNFSVWIAPIITKLSPK